MTPKKTIKIKIKPKLDVKARELTPEEVEFRQEAEALRQKMAEKGYETETRLKPTAAQLERYRRAKNRT
jgi:lipid II:glycine glycyltransferase (peptidoglycan interpeptide bridge formation enzyme)